MFRWAIVSAVSLSFVFAGCGSCGANPTHDEPTFSVGGTVTGLRGSGLILKLNDGGDLPVAKDGPFTFESKKLAGTPLSVTVKQQPTGPSQTCTVAPTVATIEQDVTDIAVTCETNDFLIGGTVMGLEGSGLQLALNDGEVIDVAQNGAFQFATAITSGETFTVAVAAQPLSPAQQCEVIGGSGTVEAGDVASVAVNCSTQAFVVGGTVTGLVGSGLVLQNNGGDDLAINANGSFAFSNPVSSGGAFAVTVQAQPLSPAQTCTVNAGTGTVANGNVTTVAVVCAIDAFAVGGTVSGLAGMGLVLQNNLGDNLPISADGTFAFPTPVASGAIYDVTVLSQPTGLSQTCAVANGTGAVGNAAITDVQVSCVTNTYAVGGTVTGLLGSGLVLRNNGGDDLPIGSDGAFTFSTPLPSGATFSVTVEAQPTAPAQTCVVTGDTGAVIGADVTSVAVNCTTNTYTVGGTVTGLSGTGLQLSLNGGAPFAVTANGTYAAPAPLPSGTAWALTIASQPQSPWQTCTLANASGTVGSADVTDVDVTCVTDSYTVGGVVTGLSGAGLILQNAGGDDLAISSDGTFTFSTPVPSGQPFAVTVSAQPTSPWQTCAVSAGAGTMAGGDVTGVTVTCTTNTYAVGGTVSGLQGILVLQNNGGDDLTLNANGSFLFPTELASGGTYAISVLTQPSSPSQTCSISGGSGAVIDAEVTSVSVTCVTNTFTVGGTVAGLAGSGLVLQDNLGDDLAISADGTFTFATPIASGQPYAVTVKTQPTSPWQQCAVMGGSGTVGGGDVTSVAINCTTNSYSVGGTVTGLTGTGLVLTNNGGDDLSISGPGGFAFSTPVPSGAGYSVAVKTQPTNPWQTCVVTSGNGTVAGAGVTSIQVSCTANAYSVKVNVTGLGGSGLKLQKNGGDTLAVAADGLWTFATPVSSGAAWTVSVLTQPTSRWQTCTASPATGTMAGADVTVAVSCVDNVYTVGGTVTGLGGSGLVLQNNGGNDLAISANGAFTFGAPVPSGASYSVTVKAQPNGPSQYCSVTSGSGTMAGANVTNVSISCVNGMGTVRDVSGVISAVFYVPCGNGTVGNCTQAVAENSCAAIGRKLVSHASDGTAKVTSLGASASCYWSISYFTNTASSVAGQCLIGISNASWSSCCTLSSWHGNIVDIPATLGQQFGYTSINDTGYNSGLTNAMGSTWGCFDKALAPPPRSGCSVYNVACK